MTDTQWLLWHKPDATNAQIDSFCQRVNTLACNRSLDIARGLALEAINHEY